MKISFLFLLIGCLSVSAASHSQEAAVSLKIKNKTISQVFDEIQRQTSYSFWFETEDVDVTQKVSVSAEKVSVENVLKSVLKDQDVDFSLKGNHILIVKKNSAEKVTENKIAEQVPVKLTGTIVDDQGSPVIGASVLIKGTTNGTTTDLDGNFALAVNPKDIVLVSFIGYASQEIVIDKQQTLKVVLKDNLKLLDEVVVVGYGTQKKVNLTGAISSVKMDDVLGDRPVTSALAALEGVIPGLQINRDSGKPGVGFNVNIRGVTSINGGSPLILVDNVPMDMNMVDPNDIENISVLKDAAAAAIYGARAAFGVILVTTKQGVKGSPIRVNYSNNFSFSKVASNPDKISPGETLKYFKDLGIETYYAGQNMQQWTTYLDEYENQGMHQEGFVWGQNGYRYDLAATDPYRDMLDKAGFQQQHNVAVQGGGNKSFGIGA